MGKKQIWWCEKCFQAGMVVIPKEASIADGHAAARGAHREKSPDCPTDNISTLHLLELLRKNFPFWVTEKIDEILETA